MSYRDRGSALERIERLEAALRDGTKPKRPLRWLDGMVFMLVAFVVATVVVAVFLLVR